MPEELLPLSELNDDQLGKLIRYTIALYHDKAILPADPALQDLCERIRLHVHREIEHSRNVSQIRRKAASSTKKAKQPTKEPISVKQPPQLPLAEPPKKSNIFTPPTEAEVNRYIQEYTSTHHLLPTFTAAQWLSFYESKGWMIGKNKMKNWKAAIRTWFEKDKKLIPELPPKPEPNDKVPLDNIKRALNDQKAFENWCSAKGKDPHDPRCSLEFSRMMNN